MWKVFWEWFIDNFIYNTIVTVAVVIIILKFLKPHKIFQKLGAWFGNYKKIKVGANGIELERNAEKDSDKDKRQDEILDSVREELKKINKRLDAHYGFIRDAVVQSGKGVVWSGTKAPFQEIIQAALLNIMLGENGNLVPRVVTVIMQEGQDGVSLYRSELNRFIRDSFLKPRKDIPEHFKAIIKKIDAEIH